MLGRLRIRIPESKGLLPPGADKSLDRKSHLQEESLCSAYGIDPQI